MKSYAKKKSSKRKVAQKATGGGPPPSPLDSETEEVLGAISHEIEIPSFFDSEITASSPALQPGTSNDVAVFEVEQEHDYIRYTITCCYEPFA